MPGFQKPGGYTSFSYFPKFRKTRQPSNPVLAFKVASDAFDTSFLFDRKSYELRHRLDKFIKLHEKECSHAVFGPHDVACTKAFFEKVVRESKVRIMPNYF